MKLLFLRKVFSPFCMVISLLFLFYVIFRSEIIWNGQNRNYYFSYYILSLTLIFFSSLSFYFTNKIKDYLIISLLSIVVGLYSVEAFLTKDFHKKIEQLKKERLYKKETGKKYDKRTKFEIYNDLKKINENIAVTAYPKLYTNEKKQLHTFSGISNTETIFCNENGYYSIYESDRYGFNNPDKEWDKNIIDYLLVGDSFAQGYCVNRPHDISSVLRTLSNKSVLNLGSVGIGPLIEYASLREYLNPNVKKVLWIYYEGNDLGNLQNELEVKILKNYLNDLTFTQNLKKKQEEINNITNSSLIREREVKKIKKEKEENQTKFKLKKFIKIYNLRYELFIRSQPKQQRRQPKPQPEFKNILAQVKDLTSKNNSQLFFVYLPEYSRYAKKYDNNNYLLVKEIVNQLGISLIDIHKELFEKEQNPLKLFPFELNGHYTVEGYKKVAETIYRLTRKY